MNLVGLYERQFIATGLVKPDVAYQLAQVAAVITVESRRTHVDDLSQDLRLVRADNKILRETNDALKKANQRLSADLREAVEALRLAESEESDDGEL